MMHKQLLRSKIREQKRAMTETEIHRPSAALLERLLTEDAYRQADTIPTHPGFAL